MQAYIQINATMGGVPGRRPYSTSAVIAGMGNEILNLARKADSYQILRRQQQGEIQENDAIPLKAVN
jgi:hypothetical protein